MPPATNGPSHCHRLLFLLLLRYSPPFSSSVQAAGFLPHTPPPSLSLSFSFPPPSPLSSLPLFLIRSLLHLLIILHLHLSFLLPNLLLLLLLPVLTLLSSSFVSFCLSFFSAVIAASPAFGRQGLLRRRTDGRARNRSYVE